MLLSSGSEEPVPTLSKRLHREDIYHEKHRNKMRSSSDLAVEVVFFVFIRIVVVCRVMPLRVPASDSFPHSGSGVSETSSEI